jgi:hypothetical protein
METTEELLVVDGFAFRKLKGAGGVGTHSCTNMSKGVALDLALPACMNLDGHCDCGASVKATLAVVDLGDGGGRGQANLRVTAYGRTAEAAVACVMEYAKAVGARLR